MSPLLKCEAAKSGRAKCRRCLEKIEKGSMRIGLDSWIAGRLATTWQDPSCFAKGMSFNLCESGRGKCKVGNEAFEKNQPRLTFQSHQTTAHVCLDHASKALQGVLGVLPSIEASELEGFELLSDEEQEKAKVLLKTSDSSFREKASLDKEDDAEKEEKTMPKKRKAASAASADKECKTRQTKKTKQSESQLKNDDYEDLVKKYLEMTSKTLPKLARERKFVVHFDHCFQRIILDNIFGDCWYKKLDKHKTAYKQLSKAQLKQAIGLAERFMADQSGEILREKNRFSLNSRKKTR